MHLPESTAESHYALTRRFFLQQLGVGIGGIGSFQLFANDSLPEDTLAQLIAELSYLTPSSEFRNVERHLPLPYKLPREQRLELGLERETWQLELTADPESNSRLRNPLSKEAKTALDFEGLMKLARTKTSRYLKVMTCNNIGNPLGMGLWEGVPLRDVLWLARPDKNIRRVFYRGFHNEKEDQIFQSSLPIGRVLEDPPGEQPVILCYKLNGKPLTGERGGPVRMIVPDAYGFKSIKWIQQIFVTNNHQANDTYAEQNNDIDSKMKTYARFLSCPTTVTEGESIPITGIAQAGMSGLTKIQYWLHPAEDDLPKGDRYFTTIDWKDAQILTPDKNWDGRFSSQKLPQIPHQIDPNGQPTSWPLPNTITHWATIIPPLEPGKYQLRCRTIDRNGIAQPMPRPFQKSGGNAIHMKEIEVTA